MAIDFEFEMLLRAAMATDVTVMAATDALANEVAEEVKSHTPVFGDKPARRSSPAYGDPGDAREAVKVVPHPNEPLGRRVQSNDFKAPWIEVGSSHMPEYAPFAKAAKNFGGTGPVIGSGTDRKPRRRGRSR